MAKRSVIIVGTGVFGISTAEHIRERWPMLRLSIISNPSPLAPTDDVTKIVRIDYSDPDRMKEAIAAQEFWKSNSFFAPFYHMTGRLVAYDDHDTSTLDGIQKTREQLGLQKRLVAGHEELERIFGSIKAPKHMSFVLNPDDAVIDWNKCVSQARARIEASCLQSGGAFTAGRVEGIEHKGQLVTALKLAGGLVIDTKDSDVVLAVGPWLAEVLADSGIRLPPPDRLPIATGVFAYGLQLDHDQAERYKGQPAFSHIGRAEFLPPLGDDGRAKITWIEPFTNRKNGSSLSRVQDVSGSVLAMQELGRMATWAREFLPGLEGAKVISITSCWDGVTATQDPLLARHPSFGNLVCAAGGSFTRAKDITSIGGVLADIINGDAEPQRFGWASTPSSHFDQPHLVGKGNFEIMEAQARTWDGITDGSDYIATI